MSTSPGEPKKGFRQWFNELRGWQQLALIILSVIVIGVAIFLSPLGEGH